LKISAQRPRQKKLRPPKSSRKHFFREKAMRKRYLCSEIRQRTVRESFRKQCSRVRQR
jgi:hypothetical protein